MKDLREILQHHLERNGLNNLATSSAMEITEQLIQQERIKAQEEVINKIVGLLFDKNGYFRKGSHPLLSELDELKQSLAEREEK